MSRLRTYLASAFIALLVVIISAYVGFREAANYATQLVSPNYAIAVTGVLMGLMLLIIFGTLSVRAAYSLQRKRKEKSKNS